MIRHSNYYTLLFLLAILSFTCNHSSRQSDKQIEEFIVHSDFVIECISQEPLLNSPVFAQEDFNGNIWVVEMPGYMRNMEGEGEDIADGQILLLSDLDHDGYFETRTVMIDSLLNPRSLLLIYRGILYTDGHALKFCSFLGKQSATQMPILQRDQIEIVDPHYIVGGNIEHQPNGLLYNIDNWIYNAKSNVRYQYKDNKWIKEATNFRGQWGMTSTEDGELIYNHNAAPLIGDSSTPNRLISNPYQKIKHGLNQYLTTDNSVHPIQATSVNRGYIEGILDEDGKLKEYSSACSPLVSYTLKNQETTALVCAPEVNQILAYKMTKDRAVWKANKWNNPSLVTSKNETFRPVSISSMADGSVLIVDLRKGIIQQRAYMSAYLMEKIRSKNLQDVNGMGRLYKISPKTTLGTFVRHRDSLVKQLENNDYHTRLQAHKELCSTPIYDGQLLKSITASHSEHMTIHLLWILDHKQLLTTDIIRQVIAQNQSARVLQHLSQLVSSYELKNEDWENLLAFAKKHQNATLDYYLLLHSSAIQKTKHEKDLLERYCTDPTYVEAIFSDPHLDIKQVLNAKIDLKEISLQAQEISENRQNNKTFLPVIYTQPIQDDRDEGFKIFTDYCSSCHGMDGKGIENLAPSLVESKIIDGPTSVIARTILNGYSASNTYQLAMPSYKNDPKMTDQAITDLISYLKSSFSESWSDLDASKVSEIRKSL